jgi:hypothetical protein
MLIPEVKIIQSSFSIERKVLLIKPATIQDIINNYMQNSNADKINGAATAISSNLPPGLGGGTTDDLHELSIFDNTLDQTGDMSAVKRSYNFDQTGESMETSPFTRSTFCKNATLSTIRTLDKMKDNLTYNEDGSLVKRSVLGDPNVMRQLID